MKTDRANVLINIVDLLFLLFEVSLTKAAVIITIFHVRINFGCRIIL